MTVDFEDGIPSGPGARGTDAPSDEPTEPVEPGASPEARATRRARVLTLLHHLVDAINRSDDAAVERAVIELSSRRRWLAPLGMIVGAFMMLFQGVKLLVTNWRLTLVQVVPAMWIWLAMLDLKIHALHDRELHVLRGLVLIPCVLGVTLLTAASFYLNGVFAFAIARPGKPEIRPAFAQARQHLGTIALWGCGIGLVLSYSTLVVTRWGAWPFIVCQSIVVGIMMFCYLAVPARIVGIDTKKNTTTRDKLAATAIGGAIGAVVCSPPYMLGRLGILMLGWRYLFWLGIVFIVVGVVLQTGATSAVKAVKFSAKLVGTPASTLRAEPSPDALT